MFGIDNFLIFLSTGILLNLYPGPDSMYIIARSISQGKMGGIFAVLGISTGALFHTIVGSIGLSAILLSSAKAFMILKYAGALYLFYQAIIMLKDSTKNIDGKQFNIQKKSLIKIYTQGALTNILNPKVALFFMALLPQFISPASPNKTVSFILLGAVFIITGTIWCILLAIFSSYFSKKLRRNGAISKWLLRTNAALFTYLGIQLALVQVRKNNL
jgi:threonine/homoserine/homoserine lactone efflux protein